VGLRSRLLPPLAPSRQATFPWSRVEAFIDGLYAIAATLLVLELRPPQGPAGTLGDALLDQWPTYLVYAFGFVQMFGGWAASRRLGAMLARADHYVLLMTMLALMSFVLTPFTFAVLGDAVHDRADFVAGVRLLSIVLTTSLVGLAANMMYIRRRGYFREGLHSEAFERAYFASVSVWVLPLVALGLSYLIGPWALVPIVLMALLSLLPFDLPGDETI
jgi:uncharacterized membrane protein